MVKADSSNTNFVHFRIIDEENEDGKLNAAHTGLTDSGTQYDGDFWGLYLAVEQVDGRFLQEHDFPEGNMYKMEYGTGSGMGEIQHQSPNGVTDASDLQNFAMSCYSNPPTEWWGNNVNLSYYYGYRTILEAIHHYDNGNGKNYFFYSNPNTSRWTQIAWDLDLSWADNMYGDGNEPFKQGGLLNKTEYNLEYQNRAREILDLLYNPDQAWQLIDETASFIYDPTGQSFVDADRAMWDYHWVMGQKASQKGMNNGQKSGQGRFYQIVPTKDFAGMLKLMKDYVVTRRTFFNKNIFRDTNFPNTPVITKSPDKFKIDGLTFESGAFSDPDGDTTFGGMKWRIAEVEPDSVSYKDNTPANVQGIDLVPGQSTWKYFKGTAEPSNPSSAWRELNFDDSSWLTGKTPLGFGETFLTTRLTDMRNNYSTVYFRKTFTVNDLDAINSLVIKVMYDDGFNIWINGKLAAQVNVSSQEMPYNGVAESSTESYEYYDFPVSNAKNFLVKGDNVIAVQGFNYSLTQSSDFFIDAQLVGLPAVKNPGGTDPGSASVVDSSVFKKRYKESKYEINPVWESEEITAYQNKITIPSAAVVAGHTYRVRVRTKDNTGRWSHWSDPVQFTAEESVNNQAILTNLKITEVMYNPVDGSDYEYIELYNAHASQSLTLDGLVFSGGLDYTFPKGVTLPPQSYLVLTRTSTDALTKSFGITTT